MEGELEGSSGNPVYELPRPLRACLAAGEGRDEGCDGHPFQMTQPRPVSGPRGGPCTPAQCQEATNQIQNRCGPARSTGVLGGSDILLEHWYRGDLSSIAFNGNAHDLGDPVGAPFCSPRIAPLGR